MVNTPSLNKISSEAIASSAVNHPYLQAFQNGAFPNIEFAIKDFAFQYGIYSSQFPLYLSAVINNLKNPQHKQVLLDNLSEEKGDTHDIELPLDVLSSITGVPHTQLYIRFQEAVGVDERYREAADQSQAATLWRDQFLQLCESDEYVGIGAIGIGTEFIVSRIYQQILKGLARHSDITITERVFFDLHSHCDDEHADHMLSIAQDLAVDSTACEKIEYGAKTALNMRAIFWDEMLVRAHAIPATESSTIKKTAIA